MLQIKPAAVTDSQFVARGICMALHAEPAESILSEIAKICQRDDVLYSWRHALIAWEDSRPLGLCLCYDGGQYHNLRQTTFPLFAALFEGDASQTAMDLDHAQDEAEAGEYYFDSLAVMPEARRHGIGARLIEAQLRRASALGFHKATLLVDPDNTGAQRLYRRLGFQDSSEVYAFGQIFWKWQVKV